MARYATAVLVRDITTNEVKEYCNVLHASKALYLSENTIYYRIKSKGQRVYAKRYQFKYANEPSVWGIV